jgi:hypothetical protein
MDRASVPEIDSAFAQSCVKMGRWSMRRRYRKLRVMCQPWGPSDQPGDRFTFPVGRSFG